MLGVRHISKSYYDNPALLDVSVSAGRGRVLAICGENGAGKSTLIKILSGAIQPDRGEIFLDDRKIVIADPRHAMALGIRTVHQELSLLPHLSVAENISLGRMPRRALSFVVDWAKTRERAAAILTSLDLGGIDIDAAVSKLSISQRQLVEIAKALVEPPRILILDEPSSVLSARETQVLFRRIRALASDGTVVIYISHRLEEIFEISDDVFVLKDGKSVLFAQTRELTYEKLIHAMVGRALSAIYPARTFKAGEAALELRNLSGIGFENVSFAVRAGEIVGMFGLVGSGRTNVARAIFGAEPATGGEIFVAGVERALRSPRDAIACRMAFISEDRKRDGLALDCSVVDNAGLASMDRVSRFGILDLERRHEVVGRKLGELSVRPRGFRGPVRLLSGGNQQKVVLAKWLLAGDVRIFIFDEPTRGVDIATKVEIYRIMADLAAKGCAILLISSEMPEVLGLSDRLIVMRAGRIAGIFNRGEIGMESLFAHAAGVEQGRISA